MSTAMALTRTRLDAVIAAAAARAGARPVPGVTVTSPLLDARGTVIGVAGRGADGRPAEFRARLVIGADGLRSVLARRLGLVRRSPRLRKLSLTAHVTGLPPADPGAGVFGEMHLIGGACLGVAPVEAREAFTREEDVPWNLTLVVEAGRFGRRIAADRIGFFRRMLETFPAFRVRASAVRFRGCAPHRADRDAGPLLASGPFDWPTHNVIADGVALVGDAAGYYDPFTGQGIYQALAGAELLAGEAAAALHAGAASQARLRGYARGHRALVAPARRLQRIIEAVVSRPALAELAIGRLGRAAPAADALVAAAGDLHHPRELLSPSLILGILVGSSPPEVVHDHR